MPELGRDLEGEAEPDRVRQRHIGRDRQRQTAQLRDLQPVMATVGLGRPRQGWPGSSGSKAEGRASRMATQAYNNVRRGHIVPFRQGLLEQSHIPWQPSKATWGEAGPGDVRLGQLAGQVGPGRAR